MDNSLKPYIIDQWSYYDYKPVIGTVAASMWLPSWIPMDERRRLLAYMLLSSYVRNHSRAWLSNQMSEVDKMARREYGDPGTIIDSVVSSVVGEDQKIWVKGAIGEADPDPQAVDQLDLLEDWAERENLLMKVMEGERTTSTLGDVVYVLGWDAQRRRPRLRVYDPGFYFPLLENDLEFPNTVHICYEYEEDVFDQKDVKFLRRITWQLQDLETPVQRPWNPPGEMSTQTCFMWDGTWRLDKYSGEFVDLDDSRADWGVDGVDLELDFIPVVHVPNTISEQEHYGTSSLARVLQILDDIVSTDTDLQAASATTGTPPIAISGAAIPTNADGEITTYGPGTVLKTGDGTATVIDTSRSLDALMEYDKALLSRLSVNSRIPEALLGRVKPNEVPSGIALTLSFTPHANLIKEMRLVRKNKYRMLLKFVSRMYMADGQLADIAVADLKFGSFLPADRSEASTLVSTLYRTEKPIISLETAVELLVQAGFPIEDAAREVLRIIEQDFQTANQLFDATGDVSLVLDRLGLTSLSTFMTPGPLPDVPVTSENGPQGEPMPGESP